MIGSNLCTMEKYYAAGGTIIEKKTASEIFCFNKFKFSRTIHMITSITCKVIGSNLCTMEKYYAAERYNNRKKNSVYKILEPKIQVFSRDTHDHVYQLGDVRFKPVDKREIFYCG